MDCMSMELQRVRHNWGTFTFTLSNIQAFLGLLEMGDFPGGTSGKEPACQCRRLKGRRFDPWVRRSPSEGSGNPVQYSCLGNPPWTEEPGGLQFMGLQKVRHDQAQDWESWRWDHPGAPNFCPYFNTSLTLLALSRARNSLCIFSLRFCSSQIKDSFIDNDTFF